MLNLSFLICSGATFGASLFLDPSEGDLILDCPNEINIYLDTERARTNTVDVKLIQNPNLEITSTNGSLGVFSSYIWNHNSEARQLSGDQKTTYILGTMGSDKNFRGKGIFATIYVTPKTLGEQHLEFYMIPEFNGDDSNISVLQDNKSIDVLDIAEGGKFNVVAGKCPIITTNEEILTQTQFQTDNENIFLATPQDKVIIKHSISIEETSLRDKIRKVLEKVIQNLLFIDS